MMGVSLAHHRTSARALALAGPVAIATMGHFFARGLLGSQGEPGASAGAAAVDQDRAGSFRGENGGVRGDLRTVESSSTGDGLEVIFSDGFEVGSVCFWSERVGYVGPTSAGDPLGVTGTLVNFVSAAPISAALAEARMTSDQSLLDSDTTDAAGAFTLSLPTGGVPIDAFLEFSASSYPNTFEFPPDPLAVDLVELEVRAISTTQLDFLYSLAGYGVHVPGTGTVVVVVRDCTGTPVAGATVTLAPAPAAIVYMSGGFPNQSATSTDASGIALGLNAPPGDTTVTAFESGRTFEAHDFGVFADGVTNTPIHP